MSTLTTKKNSLLSLALAAVLVLLSTLTMASAQPEQAQTERVSFDNIGLRRAVSASLEDSVAAEITYGPIGEWNTAEVTDMSRLFQGASSFEANLNNWNTAKVTTLAYAFAGCETFNSPLDGWTVDLVSDLTSTFEGATSFTGESIGSWNVGRVESFEQTFLGAASFVGSSDMEGWDFSSATNMHSMLFNATSFDLNVNGWNVAGVPSINSIFKNANSFSQKVCWESGLHPRAMCYQCFCNTNGAGFDVDPTACSAPPVHPSIKAYSQACEPEDQMKVKQIFDRPEEFVGGTGGTGSFSSSGPTVPEEEGQAAAGLSSGNENTVTTGARQDASAASHSWGNTIGTYHTALAVVGLVVRFF